MSKLSDILNFSLKKIKSFLYVISNQTQTDALLALFYSYFLKFIFNRK